MPIRPQRWTKSHAKNCLWNLFTDPCVGLTECDRDSSAFCRDVNQVAFDNIRRHPHPVSTGRHIAPLSRHRAQLRSQHMDEAHVSTTTEVNGDPGRRANNNENPSADLVRVYLNGIGRTHFLTRKTKSSFRNGLKLASTHNISLNLTNSSLRRRSGISRLSLKTGALHELTFWRPTSDSSSH